MRARTPLVLATAVAVAAALPAHAKGMSTLNGKKTKVLTWHAATTPQDHDPDLALEFAGQGPDFSTCKPPECLRFPFVYRPAKGVKRGALSARISWTIPGQDMDLYVLDNGSVLDSCGAGVGTSEVVVVPQPLPRHTYTLVVHEFRTAVDTVTATASFPAKDKIVTTAPAAVEKVQKVNCGIS
jgi:hypothetical protein